MLSVRFLACLANKEETFFAIKEILTFLYAKMALSGLLECPLKQLVEVVACLQGNRSALEAIKSHILLAVITGQLHYLFLAADATLSHVVFRPINIHQSVAFFAFEQDWPLLICCDLHAILVTLPAEPDKALLVIEVFIVLAAALHAPV